MYTCKNYQSKKELKEDIKAGKTIEVYQPNAMCAVNMTGRVSLEGPHYPKPHKWYASVEIVDGVITKFIS